MKYKKSVWEILRTPVVTEKSVNLKDVALATEEGSQVLTFRVDPDASKYDIKRAVEEVFGVKVSAVNTVNYIGKRKQRGLIKGKRSDWKKAYVTLKKGEASVDYAEAV